MSAGGKSLHINIYTKHSTVNEILYKPNDKVNFSPLFKDQRKPTSGFITPQNAFLWRCVLEFMSLASIGSSTMSHVFTYPSSQDTIWHCLRTKLYFLETSTLTEALICKLCSRLEWLRNNHKGPRDTLQTQTNKERLFKVVVLHFHPALSC